MPIVTQSRNLPNKLKLKAQHWDGNFALPVTYFTPVGCTQTTTSYRTTKNDTVGENGEELLSGLRNRTEFAQRVRASRRTSQYDTGNEFTTVRTLPPAYSHPRLKMGSIKNAYGGLTRYEGYLIPGNIPGWNLWPDAIVPDGTRVASDGANCIRATIPTAPEAGLAQFIAECKEKLPNLIGAETYNRALRSGVKKYNSTGDEILNYQFGLKPFISDLEKFSQSVLRSNELLTHLRDNSESVVRRGFLLREESITTPVTNYNGTAVMSTFYGQPMVDKYFAHTGSHTYFNITREKVWFNGAYTFYIHGIKDLLDRMQGYEQKANYLLGTRINANLVYQITPWSWLLDWFSDVGTFISNATALSEDSLVLRYGYVMHETHATRVQNAGMIPLTAASRTGDRPWLVTSYWETVRKQRRRASPYGFGVDVGTLNPRRWAILGALGMTKAPGRLR